MKKLKLISLLLFLLLCITVIFCYIRVNQTSNKYLYHKTTHIPHNKVALLLGTSKNLSNGRNNLYFSNRIQAAVELYKAGKTDYFIISGDNSRKNYNEPQDMKEALIGYGVPENIIFLDFAGFRTFDSVVRCKEIFGQQQITIISQKFHTARAVFIARQYNIEAIGFNAADVNQYAGIKTNIREVFARVKLFIDLFLINQQPRFLGDKIEIK
jgi:SanA protein